MCGWTGEPSNIEARIGSRPMLDVKLLREHPELIRANLEKRGDTARVPILESAIRWDREWREGQQELDRLRHQRNVVTGEIRDLKSAGRDASGKIREAAELPGPPKGLRAPGGGLPGPLRGGWVLLPKLLPRRLARGRTG